MTVLRDKSTVRARIRCSSPSTPPYRRRFPRPASARVRRSPGAQLPVNDDLVDLGLELVVRGRRHLDDVHDQVLGLRRVRSAGSSPCRRRRCPSPAPSSDRTAWSASAADRISTTVPLVALLTVTEVGVVSRSSSSSQADAGLQGRELPLVDPGQPERVRRCRRRRGRRSPCSPGCRHPAGRTPAGRPASPRRWPRRPPTAVRIRRSAPGVGGGRRRASRSGRPRVDHRQLVRCAVLDRGDELVGQAAERDDDQHREHGEHDRGQAQLDPAFLDQPPVGGD